MATQDTQNSILVGSAALAQFWQVAKQHPQPELLAFTGLNLANAAVSALSPTSKALPWLSLAMGVFQAFFPQVAQQQQTVQAPAQ